MQYCKNKIPLTQYLSYSEKLQVTRCGGGAETVPLYIPVLFKRQRTRNALRTLPNITTLFGMVVPCIWFE